MNLSNRDRKKQKQRRWSSASKRFKSDPSPVSDISSSCIFSSKFFFLYTLSLSIERPGKSNDSSLSIDREREHTKILFFRTGGILKKKNCHSQNSWRGRGGASAGSGGGRSFFSFLFFPQNNTLNILHLKPNRGRPPLSHPSVTRLPPSRYEKIIKRGREEVFSQENKNNIAATKKEADRVERTGGKIAENFLTFSDPQHTTHRHTFFYPFPPPRNFIGHLFVFSGDFCLPSLSVPQLRFFLPFFPSFFLACFQKKTKTHFVRMNLKNTSDFLEMKRKRSTLGNDNTFLRGDQAEI